MTYKINRFPQDKLFSFRSELFDLILMRKKQFREAMLHTVGKTEPCLRGHYLNGLR